jgi:hypothetical protein
MSGA